MNINVCILKFINKVDENFIEKVLNLQFEEVIFLVEFFCIMR